LDLALFFQQETIIGWRQIRLGQHLSINPPRQVTSLAAPAPNGFYEIQQANQSVAGVAMNWQWRTPKGLSRRDEHILVGVPTNPPPIAVTQ
jgi:hypothetical protein